MFLLCYAAYFGSFFLIHKAKPDLELNNVLKTEFKEYLEKDGWFEKNKHIKCKFNHWKEFYDSDIKGCAGHIVFFEMPFAKTLVNFFGKDFYAISLPESLQSNTDINEKLHLFLLQKPEKSVFLLKVQCSTDIGFFLKCPGIVNSYCSMKNYSISIF
jgi:hypothetical protein